jgi:hypothetical protein
MVPPHVVRNDTILFPLAVGHVTFSSISVLSAVTTEVTHVTLKTRSNCHDSMAKNRNIP